MLMSPLALAVAGCGAGESTRSAASSTSGASASSSAPRPTDRTPSNRPGKRPHWFTIRPDNYHVPHAGSAEDGRLFFLSDELFDWEDGVQTNFVGLFLWNADGTPSEVRVDRVPRPTGLPPGQAVSAGADELIEKRLSELGQYRREPITVQPFLRTVDGVKFGWAITKFDSLYSIDVVPGNFIAYYEPWTGHDYDT